MDKNAWTSFVGEAYTLVNLGRPAVFYLPSHKLHRRLGRGTVEDRLHSFLHRSYGGFTTTLIPSFGIWRGQGKRVWIDECRQYKVSFVGARRIPTLLKKLAEIATLMQEECIYFEAGEDACLIYPKKMVQVSKT